MYILAHNFVGVDDQFYYIRCEPFQELYNPEFATEFKTKKAAIDWSKENSTLSEYAVALDKDKEIKKFQAWCKDGMIRCNRELVNKEISRKYEGEDKYKVLEWWISRINEDASVRFEDYKTWPHLFQVFTNLHGVESYRGNKDTKSYISFQMSCKPDADFQTFKEELELVLPIINYLNKEYKTISIFDHGLSEVDTYYFYYKDDKDCYIKGRWSEKVKGTLEEVFKYWKKELYYE